MPRHNLFEYVGIDDTIIESNESMNECHGKDNLFTSDKHSEDNESHSWLISLIRISITDSYDQGSDVTSRTEYSSSGKIYQWFCYVEYAKFCRYFWTTTFLFMMVLRGGWNIHILVSICWGAPTYNTSAVCWQFLQNIFLSISAVLGTTGH